MRSSKVNTGDSGLASQYNNLRSDAYGASQLLAHQQDTPDLTLKVETGFYYIGTTKVLYAGGNSPSFTAPTTNPRIDLLVIDNAGTLSRVVGTEAGSPSAPTYPTDKIVICETYNLVGQTSIKDTSDGTNGYIYKDARPFLRAGIVDTDSVQTINGLKTFGSIPVLPSSDPTNANEATRKAYVDSQVSPTGAIIIYGASSAPSGWLLCDGSAVSRTTYAALFAIIGTTYGAGNGSTTFNLPNLKGSVPVGYDSGQTEFNSMGKTGGEKTHVLTTGEMPSHNHSIPSRDAGGASGDTNGSTYTGATKTLYTDSSGGGAAHNNLQPYITLQFIIKS